MAWHLSLNINVNENVHWHRVSRIWMSTFCVELKDKWASEWNSEKIAMLVLICHSFTFSTWMHQTAIISHFLACAVKRESLWVSDDRHIFFAYMFYKNLGKRVCSILWYFKWKYLLLCQCNWILCENSVCVCLFAFISVCMFVFVRVYVRLTFSMEQIWISHCWLHLLLTA